MSEGPGGRADCRVVAAMSFRRGNARSAKRSGDTRVQGAKDTERISTRNNHRGEEGLRNWSRWH